MNTLNKKDIEILDRYAEVIFGCRFDDLSEQEGNMLIAHVRRREPEFQNHR